MLQTPEIHLFVADAAILSSLEFALAVQGFRAQDGSLPDDDLSTAAATVICAMTVAPPRPVRLRSSSRTCAPRRAASIAA